MPAPWPELPYDAWHETRDTLHAHTQVLGKLAATLAPPSLSCSTRPCASPHAAGSPRLYRRPTARARSVSCSICTPTRRWSSTATGARCVFRGRPIGRSARSRASCWPPCGGSRARWSSTSRRRRLPGRRRSTSDEEHASFDTARVDAYFEAATRAAMVLAALRAPYRGRSTPVNAWWGSFDLAVSLFSGKSVEPPGEGFIWRNAGDAEQVEVGWWPGDARYGRAAFYAYALPAPVGSRTPRSSPPRRTGMPISASSSWTGMTSATIPIPTRARSRSRARGPTCVHGVRLGSGPGSQRRGHSAARRLSLHGVDAGHGVPGRARARVGEQQLVGLVLHPVGLVGDAAGRAERRRPAAQGLDAARARRRGVARRHEPAARELVPFGADLAERPPAGAAERGLVRTLDAADDVGGDRRARVRPASIPRSRRRARRPRAAR